MIEGKKGNFILPKKKWNKFESESDKLEKLKKWKLVSAKATEFKTLYYKGIYSCNTVECEVIGYVDDNEIIIFVNDRLHSIHPDYLLEMQKKEFYSRSDMANLKKNSDDYIKFMEDEGNYIKFKRNDENYNLEELFDYYEVESEDMKVTIQDIFKSIGDSTLGSIDEFLELNSLSYKKSEIERILAYDKWKRKEDEKKKKLEKAKDHIKENMFKGKRLVFTGGMKETRINMMIAAIKYGAITSNTISKKTDFLIVGKKPGGKLDKAKEYGVATITEEEFWKFIGGKENAIQLAMF